MHIWTAKMNSSCTHCWTLRANCKGKAANSSKIKQKASWWKLYQIHKRVNCVESCFLAFPGKEVKYWNAPCRMLERWLVVQLANRRACVPLGKWLWALLQPCNTYTHKDSVHLSINIGSIYYKLKAKTTNLCGSSAAFKVSWHKQVDNRPADPLGGQYECQWPPEAQHLSDASISLKKTNTQTQNKKWMDWLKPFDRVALSEQSILYSVILITVHWSLLQGSHGPVLFLLSTVTLTADVK